MKNTDDLCYTKTWQPPFPVSKDTKEDTDKSIKDALYILRYTKIQLSGWINVKQWQNQACNFSHYQITLVWRHQVVSLVIQ